MENLFCSIFLSYIKNKPFLKKGSSLFVLIVGCMMALGGMEKGKAEAVTFSGLLEEMTDRDSITRFPSPVFRTLQASSYNRESVSPDKPGWFADSDGEGFIRTEEIEGKPYWVIMEDDGPGCIVKIWAVCFYYGMDNVTGGNVKIFLDGNPEPAISGNLFDLVQGKGAVPAPFAQRSVRAGNLYLPIPYGKSCKVVMDVNPFYNIINYRSYPKGTKVQTFSPSLLSSEKAAVDKAARCLENKTPAQNAPGVKTIKGSVALTAGGESKPVDLPEGSRALVSLKTRLTVNGKPVSNPQVLRSVILKISFDGEQTIWCPLGDFFNNGVGHKTYSMWERSVSESGDMVCRWVMPYRKNATVTWENLGTESVDCHYALETAPYTWEDGRSMYFHATWRMDPPTPTFPLFDLNLVEIKGKGVFVGDQFTVLNPSSGWWGEGDEKIYADIDFQNNFPSHFGTGTEDYYGWAGGVVPTPADEFSQPFLANVRVGSPNAMGYNTCSRTRSLDAIPFVEQFKFDMEASCGTRQSWYHLLYSSTAFWYAVPGAKNNRTPLPDMAREPLMTVEELQKLNEEKKADVFVVPGALEAENLTTWKMSADVEEKGDLPCWGEISNKGYKGFHCKKEGTTVSVKITEQFSPVKIRAFLFIGPSQGSYNIFVNGRLAGTCDLHSPHAGITTPSIDLGTHDPVSHGNAFEIKFEYKGEQGSPPKRDALLGVDCFLLEETAPQG